MHVTARAWGVILPLLAVVLGPWLGLSHAATTVADGSRELSDFELPVPHAPVQQTFSAPRSAGGPATCGCKTVVVNADNEVKHAKVKTGDALVENVSVTYVTPAFVAAGETDINVDQEAVAISGDAVAGQVLGIESKEPGCTHMVIRATNDVEDTKVKSGDAIAVNKSIVLLDPGVRRGDLNIDVDQDAEAHSGRAVAGQIIGAVARGDGCSSVDLVARNTVRDTKVKTGDALTDNESQILTCSRAGCTAELTRLLRTAPNEVAVCSTDGCEHMSPEELVAQVAEPDTTSDVENIGRRLEPAPYVSPQTDIDPDDDCGSLIGVLLTPPPPPTPPTPPPNPRGTPAATATPSLDESGTKTDPGITPLPSLAPGCSSEVTMELVAESAGSTPNPTPRPPAPTPDYFSDVRRNH